LRRGRVSKIGVVGTESSRQRRKTIEKSHGDRVKRGGPCAYLENWRRKGKIQTGTGPPERSDL